MPGPVSACVCVCVVCALKRRQLDDETYAGPSVSNGRLPEENTTAHRRIDTQM